MVRLMMKRRIIRGSRSWGFARLNNPRGFSAAFFHSAWPIISDNVCEAVLEFIHHGKLLKEVNSIIITLVPKRKNPSSMGDYQPISCCNIIYKCIIKILANKMIPGLEEVN
jgi:hypothetical protein